MSKVDWGLAPEGATHYNQNNEMFYLLKGGIYHFYASDDVELLVGGPPSDYDLSTFVERIKVKPWSGPEDGLPPVGAKVLIGPADGCEWLENFEGREAEIIAHNVGRSGDPTAVFKCFDDDGFPIYHAMVDHPSNFRAIKHKEDKRETAIRELMDIAQVDCRVTAARLVDAGFKREVV